jgi:hypothetical protein
MNLAAARRVQDMVNPHELEVAMTCTSRSYQAEIAVDAVRRQTPKALRAAPGRAQEVTLEAAPSPRLTANGQNWRWWQDYGAGKYAQPLAQKELSR